MYIFFGRAIDLIFHMLNQRVEKSNIAHIKMNIQVLEEVGEVVDISEEDITIIKDITVLQVVNRRNHSISKRCLEYLVLLVFET